ncbi:MAG: NAD+ synthase [Thioalkalispiraceae bacterium]|jgi:NAD+ synthase (glutamine-hydrolysing)
MNAIKLVMAQLDFLVGDIEGNADKIINACEKAVQINAQVIVFPELALTGYPPEDLLLRPELHQRCDVALEKIVKSVANIDVVLGYPKWMGAGLQNMAGVIQSGRITYEYAKQTLPNYKVFDEMRYFLPGYEPCVANIAGIPMGLTICEDVWVDEPVKQAVEAGAKCILNLNASPYHTHKSLHRKKVIEEHARSNHIPLVYTNLVGGQDELVFDGESFVVNAEGEVVRRAPAFVEDLFLVEINWDGQQVSIPQQECADLLEENESIYRALVTGVRDYVHKNGFNGAVIGLSGGIDSALTLAIAVDALGAEHVEAVTMPSRYTADMSIEDARQECKNLGIECEVVPIETTFNAFLELLQPLFENLPVDTTEENIQARCRGIILMAISNKKRKMVLTTGNKSEMAVGYATLYGDMAGGFAVLKDVLKTRVYALANWRNQQSEAIPQRVIDRPPSAELAPDQKDSDSLPEYSVLDPILERYIEFDQGVEEIIAAGFEQRDVKRVMYLVDTSEYKRRQAPPGVRITERAFGRDRRYPITSGFHYAR